MANPLNRPPAGQTPTAKLPSPADLSATGTWDGPAPAEPPSAEVTEELTDVSLADISALPELEATGAFTPTAADQMGATQAESIERLGAPTPRPKKPAVAFTMPGYEILGELGRGGMGVVYKAVQTQLKRVVALKMILAGAQAGSEDEARFRREVEAVARLQHPNIVQVYEVGTFEGKPYCSLEFLEGGGLDQRLKGEPQPALLAARIVETLAGGVEAAHRHGIIHRDLKPGNVLLGGAPDAPLDQCTPKICDFGLAKTLDDASHQTQSGSIMGTPSYMAPEQAEGRIRDIGPGTDVYALGAILYDLLTGRPPFKGSTVYDTLEQVRSQDPVAPRQLLPMVPHDLETICLKCLHKEAGRRYASALELAADLRRFQNGEPILARPTGTVERVVKWARRRPAVAALIAVSALALIGAIGGGYLFLVNDFKHKEQARQQKAREELLRTLDEGKTDVAGQRWDEARAALARAQAGLDAVPEIDDLRPEMEKLQRQVQEQLQKVQEQREQQAARNRAEQRLSDFVRVRDTALLHATLSIGEDVAANLRAADQQARTALNLFGVSPESDTPATLPSALTPAERTQVTEDCYVLLLVVADVEAEKKEKDSAAAATRILRRADRLGIDTRAVHQRRARYLARQPGHEADARSEAEAAARFPVTRALDYYLLGDDHFKEGLLEKAARDFDSVLLRKSDHFLARYLLGVCYVRLGRWAQAKDVMTACISQQPEMVWLYLLRGFSSEALREFPAAENDFKKAEELLARAPDDDARYALLANRGVLRYRQKERDLGQAVADLRRAVALRPRKHEAHLTLAEVYETQAAEDLKRALIICPEVQQTFVLFAQGLRSGQDWDEAGRNFDRAVACDPRSAFLRRQRASYYLQRGRLGEALADFRSAAAIVDPQMDEKEQAAEHAVDLVESGKILLLRKEYEAAQKVFEQALVLRPRMPDACLYRAKALLDMPCATEAEHVACYEQAVRSLDDYLRDGGKPSVEVYLTQAQVLTRLQKYEGAVEAYTLALALEPNNAAIRAARGWQHLATHARALARKDFDRAIQLDPRNVNAYNGRAQLRVTGEEYEQAVADAETALRLGGETAPLLCDAARTYALAMNQLDIERSKLPPLTPRSKIDANVRQRAAYGKRAVALLSRALASLPAADRPAFWRERVLGDKALEPVRRSEEFAPLKGRYAGLGAELRKNG